MTNLSSFSTSQRRQQLIIGGAAILFAGTALVVGIFEVSTAVANRNNGTLKLTVVPADATLTIDHSSSTTSDTLSLAPGSHAITFTRKDFITKTITVTVTAHKTSSQTIILGYANSGANAYIANHPAQAAIADGAGSAELIQNGQIITQDYPLIQILPYVGADFNIDFGVSQKYPNDSHATAIYISADTDAGRTHALNWIRANGYNPDAYEIIYVGFGGSAPNPVQAPSNVIPDGD